MRVLDVAIEVAGRVGQGRGLVGTHPLERGKQAVAPRDRAGLGRADAGYDLAQVGAVGAKPAPRRATRGDVAGLQPEIGQGTGVEACQGTVGSPPACGGSRGVR